MGSIEGLGVVLTGVQGGLVDDLRRFYYLHYCDYCADCLKYWSRRFPKRCTESHFEVRAFRGVRYLGGVRRDCRGIYGPAIGTWTICILCGCEG